MWKIVSLNQILKAVKRPYPISPVISCYLLLCLIRSNDFRSRRKNRLFWELKSAITTSWLCGVQFGKNWWIVSNLWTNGSIQVELLFVLFIRKLKLSGVNHLKSALYSLPNRFRRTMMKDESKINVEDQGILLKGL